MLNKKGFAISTMLYGILIMTSLLMVLILSLMSFRKKTTTDYTDTVEQQLNTAQYKSDFTNSCPS